MNDGDQYWNQIENIETTLTFEIARVTNEDGTSLPKVVKRSSHGEGRKTRDNWRIDE